MLRLATHTVRPTLARHFWALPARCSAWADAGPAGWSAAATVSTGGGSLAERLAALVAAGTLRHDPQQVECVARLDRLRADLADYRQAAAEHQVLAAEYQLRRTALQQQLVAAEEARLLSEEQAAEAAASSRLSGMTSWLSAALGAGGEDVKPRQRSPAQRTAVARTRVERRLAEQLGAAPAPPKAPKGVYLHGSVGSGKSLLMDLLSTAVHAERAASRPSQRPAAELYHRRLHFNAAMLEMHSRMHAIESHRMAGKQQQMGEYAASLEQQQRDAQHAQQAEGGQEGGEARSGWQQMLKRDPTAGKMQRSKSARVAFRRVVRDKMNRSAAEHSAALASSNASILRHAARAMIRNCDTLRLMGVSSGGTGSSTGSSTGSGDSSSGLQQGSEEQGGEGKEVGGKAAEVAVLDTSGGRIAALLCFDEMQISDPFSAVALKALLEALAAEGCVVVATSNRSPRELDCHGSNEEMFAHFIDHLESACDTVSLNAGTDYRRLLAATAPPLLPLAEAVYREAGSAGGEAGSAGGAADASQLAAPHPQASYFYPLGAAAEAALEAQWHALTGASSGVASSAPTAAVTTSARTAAAATSEPAELAVMFGRRLQVQRAVGGVAWFTFEELCAVPLGAADYMALSQAYHTVFLQAVPALSMQVRDQARRFITLVDELYNHRTRLVCSAATQPDLLFAGAESDEPIFDLESLQFESAVEGSRLRRDLMVDGGVAPVAVSAAEAAAAAQRLGGVEERFAFARAVSRIYEMQSPLYLASRPRE